MNIDAKALRTFVEANPKLVTRRESVRYPGLFVIKYTRKVFYDALWNVDPLLLEARGLVVDKDYNVVIYPFTKIFNYGENNTGLDLPADKSVLVVRKINGFLGCVTANKRIINTITSTTGSLDSPFVDMAMEVFAKQYALYDRIVNRNTYDGTLMFEVCHADDPHIIPEHVGAYLIGMRRSDGTMVPEDKLDTIAHAHLAVRRPETKVMTMAELLTDIKTVKHEGYVVHDLMEQIMPQPGPPLFKIKSPYYLVNKFLARKNPAKLLEIIGDIHAAKQTVDEEFYPLLEWLNRNKESFCALNEQERLHQIRNFFHG